MFKPKRLPHPAFLRAILFRAAGIWIVNRAILAMVGLTTATVATAILIIALTAWLTAYDGRRSGEDLLLASFRRRQVLSSASIWATPGRLTALLGRNGTGKSTLIKIAAGWMRPNYGVVVYKEERFARPHLARLAQLGLFYLPERYLLCTTRTVR